MKKSQFAVNLLLVVLFCSSSISAQVSFGSERVITTAVDGVNCVYAFDLDGDSDKDVLSASTIDGKVAWYQNDGKGHFGNQQVIATRTDPRFWFVYVSACDLDGDGDKDVLAVYFDRIAWYENDGTGHFGGPQNITPSTDPRSAYVCDLDNDGDLDVLSVEYSQWGYLTWYENDGAGNFGSQQPIQQVLNNPKIYAYDLDGDGDMDLLFAYRDRISWYENLLINTDVENNNRVVHDFRLSQNYPNPFNPTTVISYQLSVNSAVKLKIYDLSGREITTIVNERKPAGRYSVEWDAKGLASGIYYYRLEAGNHIETRKMIVMK